MQTQYETAAIHEAGHAVVHRLSPTARPLTVVRATPAGGGGLDYATREQSDLAPTRSELRREIYEAVRILCAGPIAEALATGDCTGHLGDFAKIRGLVPLYAVCSFTSEEIAGGRISDAAAGRAIDTARGAFLTAFRAAEFLVRSNWGQVLKISEALIRCGGAIPGALVDTMIEVSTEAVKLPESEAETDALFRDAARDPQLAPVLERVLAAEVKRGEQEAAAFWREHDAREAGRARLRAVRGGRAA